MADRAMFGWIFTLTPKERSAFAACAGGWALDAMDVQMFSFVIPALIATWGITRGQAGALGTAALLASAAGGWLAGWVADRYGRVRTLQLAIAWFAVFTFLSGVAQNYQQLFVMRALLGVGFGGEWAAGAVLLGEVMRPEHRGKALGFMQAGWAIGWGAAALLYALFFSIMPAATAWRMLFMVGILPALLVFFVRRYVQEPDVYLKSRAVLAARNDQPSFLEIFRPPLLRVTLLGGLLGTGAQGGWPFFTELFPTRVRGVGQGFAYNIGRATGAFFPALVGVLSARMGLGQAIGIFAGAAYAIMAVAAFVLPETRGKALAPD